MMTFYHQAIEPKVSLYTPLRVWYNREDLPCA